MSTTTNPIIDFAAAIRDTGLGSPKIAADGEIHRFHCKGDHPDSLNGWYVLRMGAKPFGAFGSWKTGVKKVWRPTDRRLSRQERAEEERLLKAAMREREDAARSRNATAAARAKAMMQRARSAAPQHPYLLAKQIRSHGIRQLGDALLIPVYTDDRLSSVQRISPDGAKRFLSGGRITGGYYLINDETRRPELLIAEGFATGATLHEEIGAAVFVAFNANNLLPVARDVRRRHPRADIIICGDDDRWTDGNPGAAKARTAALDIGARLLMPDFAGFDLGDKPTDFNDLYRMRRAAQGRAAA